MLRSVTAVAFLPVLACIGAESPAGRLWSELDAKRTALPGVHQEFDESIHTRLATHSHSGTSRVVVDWVPGRWREVSASGSGTHVRLFNGSDLLFMEQGGDEYVRVKRGAKDDRPEPLPYSLLKVDWTRAVEEGRQPCGLSGKSDLCVVLEVPLKPRARDASTRVTQGTAKLLVHLETGLLISARVVQNIEGQRSSYQMDHTYTLKRMSYGTAAAESTFELPAAGMQEVKELSAWNADKMKKQLTGQAAPDLQVTDMKQRPFRLSDLKGKVVLLDFWTTWCPPCRADAPALDKLYRKYGSKDLEIVAISVSEERSVVERFLKDHPHEFPVVLTTENTMPKPYQVRVFPTYIVVDRDGKFASAVEGDQGFSGVRKLLKRAGLDVD